MESQNAAVKKPFHPLVFLVNDRIRWTDHFTTYTRDGLTGGRVQLLQPVSLGS